MVRYGLARREDILQDAAPLRLLVVQRLHFVLVGANLRDAALDVAILGVPSPHQLGIVPHGWCWSLVTYNAATLAGTRYLSTVCHCLAVLAALGRPLHWPRGGAIFFRCYFPENLCVISSPRIAFETPELVNRYRRSTIAVRDDDDDKKFFQLDAICFLVSAPIYSSRR